MEIRIPSPEALKKRVNECFKHYANVRENGTQHGATMLAFEEVLIDVLIENGVNRADIFTGKNATVPGYFRATKQWDVLVRKQTAYGNVLVGLIELKSIKGSVGNNANNRVEEAVGSGYDFQKANSKLGLSSINTEYFEPPFVGYMFLMGYHEKNEGGGKISSPLFELDEGFVSSDVNKLNYKKRFEILSYRLLESKLYSSTALLLEDPNVEEGYTEPSSQLSFYNFVARMLGEVIPKYQTI